MIILGIDSSLTSTGLGWLDTTSPEWITQRVRTEKAKAGGELAQARRMRRIAAQVIAFTRECDPPFGQVDLFVIERMANYGRHAGALDLAGLWWRIVDEIERASGSAGRLLVVPTPVRAKYATGRGSGAGAGKADVLAAVRETYPEADVPNHDVADAVALAALGARLMGFPVEQVDRAWVEEVAAQVAQREQEKEQ